MSGDDEQPAAGDRVGGAEGFTIRKRGRRVTTGAIDATQWESAEPQREQSENDDRLRADRPPHWG